MPAARVTSCSCSAKARSHDHALELIARHASTDRAVTALTACARHVGSPARHHPGAHAGRLVRHPDEPVAALPVAIVPHLVARRLLPAGRRVRLPRPAAGRDGAALRRARTGARAHPPRGGPAVRRRRRAALVARTDRPRTAEPMLRRSALAAVRGRRVRARHRRHGLLDEHVPFLDGAAASRRRGRGLRPAVGRRASPERCSSTAAAPSSGASRPARTACRSSAPATGTTA